MLPIGYAVGTSLLAWYWGISGLEQVRLAITGLPIVAIAFGWTLRWAVIDRSHELPVLQSIQTTFRRHFPFALKLGIVEGTRRINAVSVGGIWTGATILLSRGAIERLSPSAQRMLVLHEVAHQMRHHAWLRQLAILGLVVPLVHQTPLLFANSSPWHWAWQMVLLAWSYFALRQINQSLEKDADVHALCLASQMGWAPRLAADVLASALEKANPVPHDRSNWTHPSLMHRMAWLNCAVESESLPRFARQSMDHLVWILMAISCIALLSVWGSHTSGSPF